GAAESGSDQVDRAHHFSSVYLEMSSVANTGVNLVLVAVGYMNGRTAPILDEAVAAAEAAQRIIDPVPQALVLTAIVIGVGVTALMLAYAYRLFKTRGTLDISRYTELKW
ncbi:MAG: NADH-quinone oxidoreductase subunit K, partial [Gammaproteobacteria bacterium]